MKNLNIKWVLFISCLLVVFPVVSGQETATHDGELFRFRYQQMGTQWHIQLVLSGRDTSLQINLQREMAYLLDSLNHLFSDYEPNSTLNLAVEKAWKAPVKIPKALEELIIKAQEFSRLSQGAFDISVGPLSRLWRRAFRRQVFPERAAVKEARKLVNYRWISPRNGKLSLKRKGMRLDLGGIAKGASVDHLANLLEGYCIENYLIDGGGDIRLSGHPPDQTAWSIALPNGQLKRMDTGAIASSGSKYQYLFHKGKRYSHLIDPRTGYGVTNPQTVTVIAPTALEADAWATVFSILDPKKASRLRARLKERVLVYYWQN